MPDQANIIYRAVEDFVLEGDPESKELKKIIVTVQEEKFDKYWKTRKFRYGQITLRFLLKALKYIARHQGLYL